MAGLTSESEDLAPLSAINITPFVDVVLVLLVIFMVTTPLILRNRITVNLPKAASGESKPARTLGIAVNAQGQILLEGVLISEPELATKLKEALAQDSTIQAVIAADIEARHGDVVRAIDQIKKAGVDRFALQVESE